MKFYQSNILYIRETYILMTYCVYVCQCVCVYRLYSSQVLYIQRELKAKRNISDGLSSARTNCRILKIMRDALRARGQSLGGDGLLIGSVTCLWCNYVHVYDALSSLIITPPPKTIAVDVVFLFSLFHVANPLLFCRTFSIAP